MKNLNSILFFIISTLILYAEDENNSTIPANLENYEINSSNVGLLPKPLQRWYHFNQERAYPNTSIPPFAREKAFKQIEELIYKSNGSNLKFAQQPEWRQIGPHNIGGRIKSIAIHPTDANIVYAGAAAGGIWKSTNGGVDWFPIFDYENSIAFGSICIDRQNPDIIWAGTGESVIGGGNIYLGSGIYKSTDAGENWEFVGLTGVGAVSKLYIHPANSNIIVFGATIRQQGFYISFDAGKTWEKRYSGNVTDVAYHPDNTETFLIGVNGLGVLKTVNSGTTWTDASSGIIPDFGRISVQISKSNPDIAYALVAYSANGMIFKSTNGGNSWTLSYQGGPLFLGNGTNQQQGFYNNHIVIHPTDPDIVIAGGIDLFRTWNGGKNWADFPRDFMHVDQHCGDFFLGDPNILFVGNDGGIYKSTDAGKDFKKFSGGLAVTQFYALAIDNSSPTINYGGTQDNGSLGNRGSENYNLVWGGDGFRMIVDYQKSNIIYGESQYGNMFRIEYGNPTQYFSLVGSSVLPNGASGEALWNSPIEMDPYLSTDIYHGRKNLFVSFNRGNNWAVLATGDQDALISEIEVNYGQNEDPVIWYGDNSGGVYMSLEGGEDGSFVKLSGNGLVNRYVTDIETILGNKETAYVCYSGYGTGHVFKTTDLGSSWKNISVNLPDAPVNGIAIHPDNPNILVVASDVGVFVTYDDGNSWLPFGRGMARSPVVDVEFHTDRSVLPQMVIRAATHGRSIWEGDFPTDAVNDYSIVNPSGGEVVIQNSPMIISWFGFDPPVKIEYSSNDGLSFIEIAHDVVGNNFRWKVNSPNTDFCRIKISSQIDQTQVRISNTFQVTPIVKGSVLLSSNVTYVPYGVEFDGNDKLFTTSFYDNKLTILNANDFSFVESLVLPGDSLFTDLCYDENNQLLYIHRMQSTNGNGASVLVTNTKGEVIREFKSPATGYPIGLELVDGNLLVGDRDGGRYLRLVNPITGALIKEQKNPFDIFSGPRGLCYDGKDYLFQASTDFRTQVLTGAFILKIDKNDYSIVLDSIILSNISGTINARGIDFDPRDRNFWITSFSGDLYKIAGFNPIVSVDENNTIFNQMGIEAKVYPNPIVDFATLTFKSSKLNGKLKIKINDLLGKYSKLIYSKEILADEPVTTQISTDSMASGMYMLSFDIDGRIVSSQKLIIAGK